VRALVLLLALAAAAAGQETEAAVVAAELSRRYDPELFARAARARSAVVRRAAARALGRIRDPRGFGLLWGLVQDESGPVRRVALFALGQLGGDAAALALREALSRLDSNDRAFALEALGKCGDPRASAAVAAHLAAPEEHVREAAALACFRLGDPSLLPDLFAALARESRPEPRWRMVYSAWRLLRAKAPPRPPSDWGAALAAASAPGRPFHERVFATLALGALGGAAPRLHELLADPDPRVVAAAVRALAKPWSAESARAVLPFVRHDDELLRECALEHLAAGGAAALPFLEEAAPALRSSPRLLLALDVARTSAGAGVLSPPAGAEPALTEEWSWRVGPFAGLLPDAPPATDRGRAACAEVCGEERIPRDVALRALVPLLKAEDDVVRATAIASLGKRGDAGHVPAIVAAAVAARGAAAMYVRLEAARALGALKTFDPWLERAAAEDPDAPVRAAARAALEALGRTPPTPAPPAGFRLHGLDASGILAAARELRGTRAVVATTKGRIEFVLRPDEAPAHCVSFATLARRGFYTNLLWHRVVANFVIQGGCPRGDGAGGPGYLLPDEIGTRPFVRGTVGMPKSDDDTGGCQIFVTHLPAPHLDGRYTVFGQMVAGFDVLDRIRVGDRILEVTLAGP